MLTPMTHITAKSLQRGSASTVLVVLVLLGAVFVWYTGNRMPNLVASHFGISGIADGFMRRQTYVNFFLGVTVVLPFLVSLPITLVLRNPDAIINLPNRDYWLAPERRAETFEFVRSQMMRFGIGLVLFLCYVHWLIVRANGVSPPSLSNASFASALIVLVGYMIVWTAIFYTRFRKPPKS